MLENLPRMVTSPYPRSFKICRKYYFIMSFRPQTIFRQNNAKVDKFSYFCFVLLTFLLLPCFVVDWTECAGPQRAGVRSITLTPGGGWPL